MSKEEKMAYYRLKGATGSYFEKKSGLHLINAIPGKIPASKVNKEITARLKGHIVQIEEDEYNKLMAKQEVAAEAAEVKAQANQFEEMSKEQLSDYAAENLEGSDLEEYNALKNNKKRVEFLTTWLELKTK